MKVYKITASVLDSNDVRVDGNQAEVLGEAYGVTYFSRAEAEEMQEALASDLPEGYESAEYEVLTVTLDEKEAIEAIERAEFANRDAARDAIRRLDRDNAIIAANWSQAASPIAVSWCGDNNDWQPTQYQVASFRHDQAEAASTIDEDDVTWVLWLGHDGSARAERLTR